MGSVLKSGDFWVEAQSRNGLEDVANLLKCAWVLIDEHLPSYQTVGLSERSNQHIVAVCAPSFVSSEEH